MGTLRSLVKFEGLRITLIYAYLFLDLPSSGTLIGIPAYSQII
jgi:hypothetical protein